MAMATTKTKSQTKFILASLVVESKKEKVD